MYVVKAIGKTNVYLKDIDVTVLWDDDNGVLLNKHTIAKSKDIKIAKEAGKISVEALDGDYSVVPDKNVVDTELDMLNITDIYEDMLVYVRNYMESGNPVLFMRINNEWKAIAGGGEGGGSVHPATHPATMIVTDENHRFVTDIQIQKWDNIKDFSGDYTDLINKPTIPTKTSEIELDNVYTKDQVNNLIEKQQFSIITENDLNDLKALDSATRKDQIGSDHLYFVDGKFVSYIFDTDEFKEIKIEGTGTIDPDALMIKDDRNVTNAIGNFALNSKPFTGDGMNVIDAFKELLFKYVACGLSLELSPSTSVYEVGTTINSLLAKANVVKNSNNIQSLKWYLNDSLVKSQENVITASGSYTYTYVNPITSNATIKVVANDGKTNVPASKTISFVEPMYYGLVDTPTFDSSIIKAFTKKVVQKGNITWNNITCTNQICVFAYPASYGNLKNVIDSNGFENLPSFTKTTVDVKNGNNTDISYNVYYSGSATLNGFGYTFKF